MIIAPLQPCIRVFKMCSEVEVALKKFGSAGGRSSVCPAQFPGCDTELGKWAPYFWWAIPSFPAQGCSGSLMPKPCSKKGCFGGFLDRKALENADGVRRKITTGNVGGARGFSLSQSVMGRF